MLPIHPSTSAWSTEDFVSNYLYFVCLVSNYHIVISWQRPPEYHLTWSSNTASAMNVRS